MVGALFQSFSVVAFFYHNTFTSKVRYIFSSSFPVCLDFRNCKRVLVILAHVHPYRNRYLMNKMFPFSMYSITPWAVSGEQVECPGIWPIYRSYSEHLHTIKMVETCHLSKVGWPIHHHQLYAGVAPLLNFSPLAGFFLQSLVLELRSPPLANRL